PAAPQHRRRARGRGPSLEPPMPTSSPGNLVSVPHHRKPHSRAWSAPVNPTSSLILGFLLRIFLHQAPSFRTGLRAKHPPSRKPAPGQGIPHPPCLLYRGCTLTS